MLIHRFRLALVVLLCGLSQSASPVWILNCLPQPTDGSERRVHWNNVIHAAPGELGTVDAFSSMIPTVLQQEYLKDLSMQVGMHFHF